MAYDDLEISNYGGKPIGLFEFRRGTSVTYYCNSETALTINGNTYQPWPIDEATMSFGGDTSTDSFNISVPRTFPEVLKFVNVAPSSEVFITYRRVQEGDTDTPVLWFGSVSQVTFEDEAQATITANSFSLGYETDGLRLRYGRECNHFLYDDGCKVLKADYKTDGDIIAITGNTVEVQEAALKDSGYYSGGLLELALEDGDTQTYLIVTHSDTELILLTSTDLLSVGVTVSLYPGCDRTLGSNGCAKFANLNNYGGIPFMPEKNPFDGDPVF